MSFLRFFRSVLRRQPVKLTALLSCMIVSSGLQAVGITLFLPVLKVVAERKEEPADRYSALVGRALESVGLEYSMGTLLVLMAIAIIVAGAAQFITEVFQGKVCAAFERDLKVDLGNALLSSNWTFMSQQKAGTLQNVLGLESRRAGVAFRYLCRVCAAGAHLTVFTGLSVVMSWQAAIVLFVLGALTLPIVNIFIRKTRDLSQRDVEANNAYQQHVIETVTGMRFLKSCSVEAAQSLKLREFLKAIASLRVRVAACRGFVAAFPYVMLSLGGLVVFYLCVTRLGHSFAATAVFILLVSKAFAGLNVVKRNQQTLAANMPSYDLCVDLLRSCRESVESSGAVCYEGLGEGIRLDNVDCLLGGRRVLSGLSLEIPRGKTVALVGSSGAGKSTVVDMIAGLVKPSSGRVVLAARDLAEYDLASWRARIGYVPQESFLINDSIRANLAFCNTEASEPDIIAAAKASRAHQFIISKPGGYSAPLGDRGVTLSGGEKQRIALARALLRKPDLLVMDEATSALDNESEMLVQQAVDGLADDITIIVIAHRLSTIRNVDRIYLLENGRVVEEGTYDQLMSAKGRFYQLQTIGS